MAKINGAITVDARPEVVFDFLADERNEPRFNPHVLRAELVSSGPIGVGSRFRAVMRSMGRPVEMTIDIVRYERPLRIETVTHLPSADVRGSLTFIPVGTGTRLRWSWDLRSHGLFRILSPVMARLGRAQEDEIWAGLKRHLEARWAPTPAGVRREFPAAQPVASGMSA